MKKVLILTVTSGFGHNSSAYSMRDKLQLAGCEVRVVDIFKEYSNKLDAWKQDRGYSLSVAYLRPVFNAFFWHYKKRIYPNGKNCACQNFAKRMHGGLLREIYQFQPDVIYCTHYVCGALLANLRRVYKLPSVNVACMLDYEISPFWETNVGGIDFLTLSHADFREDFVNRGFKNENLIYTGIPIAEKFSKVIDKHQAREKLGLRQDVFTVMIFYGGGFWHGGYSVLKALLKRIKKDVQIVIVNGKDEKTKNKIDKEMAKYPKNFVVKNIGFSKEIDLIMSACDVMIGKAGGLSTTESINKNLPLIATVKLPAQEIDNLRYLTEKGLALSFENFKDLISKIEILMENPNKLKQMQEDLEVLKTNATENIFNLLISQPEADYSGINVKLDYSRVNKIIKLARKKTQKSAQRRKRN